MKKNDSKKFITENIKEKCKFHDIFILDPKKSFEKTKKCQKNLGCIEQKIHLGPILQLCKKLDLSPEV